MKNLMEDAFKDEDVAMFTKYLEYVDTNAKFEMNSQQAYDYCNLRNKMMVIRKKCNDHVLEHIKTIKANEENQKKKDEAAERRGVKK